LLKKLQARKNSWVYSLGSRFTPHYKILQYVEAVAKANPTTMKF
jgi:hypothetical protein